MNNKIIWLLILLSVAVATEIQATGLPDSYQVIYEVSRGGKVMAEQTTTFKSIAPNQYSLIDKTQGTRGLASLTGFERKESTHFFMSDNQISAIEHSMQQKVAFKSKSYQFKASADIDLIIGKSKQSFSLSSSIKPISSHMLPWWISTQVCNNSIQPGSQINVAVLKSKRIKNYEFMVHEEGPEVYRVARTYPKNTQKSSLIWLDKTNDCLPIRTQHQEAGEPIIETTMRELRTIESAAEN